MTQRERHIGRASEGSQGEEEQKEDDKTMTLDRLVLLADTAGLTRMGLGLMEAVARAEGRILWH
jgi:hypothetical protein